MQTKRLKQFGFIVLSTMVMVVGYMGIMKEACADETDFIRADVLGLPPWGFKEGDGAYQGVMYEITQLILTKAEVPYDMQVIPVKRMIQRLQSGRANFSVILISQWSKDNLIPLVPIFEDVDSIVLPRAGHTISTYEDLGSLHLGMVRGTKIGHRIESDTTLNKRMTNNYLQSAQMLKAKRVDAIVGVAPSLYWVTRKAGMKSHELGKPYRIKTSSIWLHIAKEGLSKQVVQRLRHVTKILKEKGIFDQIMRKYIPDYKHLGEW